MIKNYITLNYFREIFGFDAINDQDISDQKIIFWIRQASIKTNLLTHSRIKDYLDEGKFVILDGESIKTNPNITNEKYKKELDYKAEIICQVVSMWTKFGLDTGWDFITGTFSYSLGESSLNETTDINTSVAALTLETRALLNDANFTTSINTGNIQVKKNRHDYINQNADKFGAEDICVNKGWFYSQIRNEKFIKGDVDNIEVVKDSDKLENGIIIKYVGKGGEINWPLELQSRITATDETIIINNTDKGISLAAKSSGDDFLKNPIVLKDGTNLDIMRDNNGFETVKVRFGYSDVFNTWKTEFWNNSSVSVFEIDHVNSKVRYCNNPTTNCQDETDDQKEVVRMKELSAYETSTNHKTDIDNLNTEINNKQPKYDISLNTKSKIVVGAINELNSKPSGKPYPYLSFDETDTTAWFKSYYGQWDPNYENADGSLGAWVEFKGTFDELITYLKSKFQDKTEVRGSLALKIGELGYINTDFKYQETSNQPTNLRALQLTNGWAMNLNLGADEYLSHINGVMIKQDDNKWFLGQTTTYQLDTAPDGTNIYTYISTKMDTNNTMLVRNTTALGGIDTMDFPWLNNLFNATFFMLGCYGVGRGVYVSGKQKNKT